MAKIGTLNTTQIVKNLGIAGAHLKKAQRGVSLSRRQSRGSNTTIVTLRQQVDKLQGTVDEKNAKIAEYENGEVLTAARKEIEDLNDKLKGKDEIIRGLETDFSDAEKAHKAELESKKEEYSALERRFDALGSAVDAGAKKSKLYKKVLVGVATALVATVVVLTVLGVITKKEADKMVAEKQAVLTENAELTDANEDLADIVAGLTDANEDLKNENAGLEAQLAELQEQLETLEANIATLDLSTVGKDKLGEIFGQDFSELSDEEVVSAINAYLNELNGKINSGNLDIGKLQAEIDELKKENELLKSLTNKVSDSLVGGGDNVSSAGVSDKFEVVRNDGAVETYEVVAGKTCVTSVVSRDAFTGAETVVKFEYDEDGNMTSQTVTQIAGNGEIISQIVSDVATGEGGNSAETGNQGGTGDATEDDSEDVRWN